jgi:hypothetical protein
VLSMERQMSRAVRPAAAPRPAGARLIVLCGVLLALTAMGQVYWQQELQYALPTPRPVDLQQIPRGAVQPLPAILTCRVALAADRPVLLHFYNPDCPCSRFNRDHVQALQLRYGDRVQFVEVVEADSADAPASGTGAPAVSDRDGAIARACGVYSTPQALLLDADRRVAFRGNFNVNRFCDAQATQFVRQAIDALLHATAAPLDPRAQEAYGCPLPSEECRARER